MSKFAISTLAIVASVVAVQGSLFGPFGPLGPFGQPVAPPAFGTAGFGQPGSFFPPGYGFQPVAPVYQPAYGPQGLPTGFAPVSYSQVASRSFVLPAPAPVFRPKPSAVLQRLQLRVLPDDLQEQLNQLLVTYEEGNAACDKLNTGAVFAGFYRRCVVVNKAAVEKVATALEQEADARDTAAAEQAAAEQAAAEQAAAEETEQAAVAEESVNEEAVVADEADVDVAEVADTTDDVEEPAAEVYVDGDAENVAVEES